MLDVICDSKEAFVVIDVKLNSLLPPTKPSLKTLALTFVETIPHEILDDKVAI